MNAKYSFRFCLVLLALFLLARAFAGSSGAQPQKSLPIWPGGIVPDETTAIAIAEAVLVPIYGKDSVHRQRPFTAKLENEIWLVTGSLPKGAAGGVAAVEISKADGRILKVSHGR